MTTKSEILEVVVDRLVGLDSVLEDWSGEVRDIENKTLSELESVIEGYIDNIESLRSDIQTYQEEAQNVLDDELASENDEEELD